MLEILLIRHGRTDWNDRHLVMGQSPVPLNETGRAQAEKLSDLLRDAGLRAIISSPVRRAVETADIIAGRQNGVDVELDAGLSEIDYGDWVGRSFSEVANENPDIWRAYHEDPASVELPCGEKISNVIKRVSRVLDDIRVRFDDGRVAVVSHADALKLGILHLLELSVDKIMKFTIDNCAIILIRIYPDVGPRLVAYNAMSLFEKDV